jgi:hypothetical protein
LIRGPFLCLLSMPDQSLPPADLRSSAQSAAKF